jgi:hypothetical protein
VQRLSFPLHSTESARDESHVVDERKAHLHPEIFGFWLLAFASCVVILMLLCSTMVVKTLDSLTCLHHQSDL